MRVKFPSDIQIYVTCGKIDIRKSIDGLSAIVSQNFKLDLFENALFIFCGGKRDRMKAILWEGDGFILLYKRLEGEVFQWPRTTDEVREITPQQYRCLIEGLAVDQKEIIRNFDNKNIMKTIETVVNI
jgi:transposase